MSPYNRSILSTPFAVRWCWQRLRLAYDAVQVELRGSYSVERMLDLQAFATGHSLAWCVLVLLVTPLPCIAIAILVDTVPLNPSREGLAHSHLFWLLRVFVPRLSRTSVRTVLAMSAVIGVGCAAYGLLMASLVGYPLPFTLFFGSPSWQVLFWASVLFHWGRELRRDATLRSEVVAFYKVVIVQLSLTAIYPGYNHVFTWLDGHAQAAFALLLPVLKILAKNAFRWVFCLAEDFSPEVVIFNVEIFHALFVSTCMQSSTSLSTTAVIMLADVIQAWLHVLDVDAILGRITLFESKPHASRLSSGGILSVTTASPLTSALLCVALDSSLQTDPSIRLEYHDRLPHSLRSTRSHNSP